MGWGWGGNEKQKAQVLLLFGAVLVWEKRRGGLDFNCPKTLLKRIESKKTILSRVSFLVAFIREKFSFDCTQ